MSLIITDDCINCDVCEPECPNAAISQGEARTCAPSVSATTTNRSASRSARWIAFHWTKLIRKLKNS